MPSAQPAETVALRLLDEADPGPPITAHFQGDFLDLDSYLDEFPGRSTSAPGFVEPWSWQALPAGLIYRSYLAGVKQSRLAAQFVNERDDGWLFDATLGAHVGLLRYGTTDLLRPRGWQIDAEASAQVRLDIPDEVDVRSADYRAGLPITYGWERSQLKFGYYHLSSHLGDEFVLKNPDFPRLNFVRDVLVLGYSHYPLDDLRLYGEAGWIFYGEISRQWEFQLGAEWAPMCPTGIRGAPFAAVHGHVREEVDFGGHLTVQAGWAWRGATGHLFRLGLHFFDGKSNQYSFFDMHERQAGLGIWYDW